MRGHIGGLLSAQPLAPFLPAILQEDDFCERFVTSFDDSLAPLFSTLDNLDCYLDPMTAPDDFVDWLAEWVGIAIDDSWPPEKRRAFVRDAAGVHRGRGTAHALRSLVEIFTGGAVDIEESGASSWSRAPRGELPGTSAASMTVRVRVDDPTSVDTAALDALVAGAKPAHVVHRIEVVTL